MRNLKSDSRKNERMMMAILMLYLFDKYYHDLLAFIQLIGNYFLALAKTLLGF